MAEMLKSCASLPLTSAVNRVTTVLNVLLFMRPGKETGRENYEKHDTYVLDTNKV